MPTIPFSFLSWVPIIPFLWTAVRGAAWATVHDWLSTSYTAAARDALWVSVILIFFLHGIGKAGGTWRDMLSRLFNSIIARAQQATGAALILWVVFTVILFVINFAKSYSVFVAHRPKVAIVWREVTDGIEVVPRNMPERITPEWLKSNKQYVARVSYDKSNLVEAHASVLFQLPYPLGPYAIYANPEAGNHQWGVSSPPWDFRMMLRGPNWTFKGPTQHKNFVLNLPHMKPGGEVRIVLTLNSNAPGRVMIQGTGPMPNWEWRGSGRPDPRVNFICATTAFSYGNQSNDDDQCASFAVNRETSVRLLNFHSSHEGLFVYFEEGP